MNMKLVGFVCAAPLAAAAAIADNAPAFVVPAERPTSRYTIDARIDPEKGTVAGEETVSLRNTSAIAISVLSFDWPRDKATLEAEAGGARLVERDAANEPPGTPRYFVLHDALAPGTAIDLRVRFSRPIEASDSETYATDWYPRLAWEGSPGHDAFSVKLDAPAGWALATSGALDPKTGRWEIAAARTFGFVLEKGMRSETREAAGVRITALFTEKGARAAAACLDAAADAIPFYKAWLGFYPFPSLVIVPGGPGRWGGYPMATGIVVVHGEETYREGEGSKWWDHITSHEIGHQYWGEWVLDPGDSVSIWIALGIYADSEFMERVKGDPIQRRGWMSNYINAVSSHYDTTFDVPPAWPEKVRFDWNNTVIHSKGPAMINALAVALGKERFERIYRACLREYGGRVMDWRAFERLCERESGESLAWFFDAWLRTNAYLCYRVEGKECRREGPGFVTEVRVRRLGTMAMPVPVRATFADGSAQTAMSDRTREIDTVRFTSAVELKDVALDPDGRLAMVDAPLPEISAAAAALLAPGLDVAWAAAEFAALRDEPLASWSIWERLGTWLLGQNRLREAAVCFTKAEGLAKDAETRAGDALTGAVIADLQGDRPAALAAYRRGLDLAGEKAIELSALEVTADRAWIGKRLETPFDWASQASRLKLSDTPSADELVAALRSLHSRHEGRNALLLWERAKGVEGLTRSFWFRLGLLLFDGGSWPEALAAVEKAGALQSDFTTWTWKGQLLDLLGRRDEAVACYRKALELVDGDAMRHDQFAMRIDRAWIERRIEEPFTWGKP